MFLLGLESVKVTHHSGKAGDELDAVLHLLLSDLHRRAVLLLQRKRIWAVLRQPQMELQQYTRTYKSLWNIVTLAGSENIFFHMKLIRLKYFFNLHFRDGDSCFGVFIQHPFNELLQLVTYQWPVKKVLHIIYVFLAHNQVE